MDAMGGMEMTQLLGMTQHSVRGPWALGTRVQGCHLFFSAEPLTNIYDTLLYVRSFVTL